MDERPASFPAGETTQEREPMKYDRMSGETTPLASPTCPGRYPG